MKKFEYSMIVIDGAESAPPLHEQLHLAGQAGWQLVNVLQLSFGQVVYHLMREI